MNTNMGLDGYQNSLHSCALDESSLRIGRVKSERHNVICREIMLGGV